MTALVMLSLKFVKLGFFCFGGGYMLIPLLISEFVGDGKILSDTVFANLVSVAQVTPGPVGINTATFVGCVTAGPVGAAFTTAGLIMPSVLLGTLAVKAIDKWNDTAFVQGMLHGTRLAAIALIVYAAFVFMGLSLFSTSVSVAEIFKAAIRLNSESLGVSPTGIIICAAATSLMLFANLSVTMLIFCSGVLGALLFPFIG